MSAITIHLPAPVVAVPAQAEKAAAAIRIREVRDQQARKLLTVCSDLLDAAGVVVARKTYVVWAGQSYPDSWTDEDLQARLIELVSGQA